MEIDIDDSDYISQLMGEALAALPDPVFVLTENGRYAAIFGGSDRSYYHDDSCLVDFSLRDVLSHELADWFLKEIRTTLQQGVMRTVEYNLAAADVTGLSAAAGPASTIRFEGRVQPMHMLINGERAVLWQATNITSRYQLEQRLRLLSETDELTGKANRRRLMNELHEALRNLDASGVPVALLLIDIDRFKSINDQFGHPAGDAVIRAVSEACGARIKRRDLFARFGGEEFATLLYNITAAQALGVAERLRQAVADAPLTLESGETMRVTVSIGVSVAGPRRRKANELLQHADAALYLAKHGGRDRVVLAKDCD